MAKKNIYTGIVYSTDPGFRFETENSTPGETPVPAQQKIRLRLETKHRGGKAVTLVDNFIGNTAEQEELGKKLKSFCGTGGSVKDGEILVQGDNRDKILQWLLKNGYTNTKKI